MSSEAKMQKIILDNNRENKFLRTYNIDKPDGWLVFDSYNNPWFPLTQKEIDTSEFDLKVIKKYFHQIYGGRPNDFFLPWHFTIDIVNEQPYLINTRPFNYKSLIPEFENHLSIMIIGDSNLDIYNNDYYKFIAHSIINSFRFLNGFRIMNQRENFTFKTGKNFDPINLFKYIY